MVGLSLYRLELRISALLATFLGSLQYPGSHKRKSYTLSSQTRKCTNASRLPKIPTGWRPGFVSTYYYRNAMKAIHGFLKKKGHRLLRYRLLQVSKRSYQVFLAPQGFIGQRSHRFKSKRRQRRKHPSSHETYESMWKNLSYKSPAIQRQTWSRLPSLNTHSRTKVINVYIFDSHQQIMVRRGVIPISRNLIVPA